MAGQPRKRAFGQRVEEAGGDEVLMDLVASGMKLKDVAERFGDTYDVFRSWLRAGGDERLRAFERAKAESADALVDAGRDAIDALDQIEDVTSAQVGRAKLKADYNKWLAGTRDREQYGDRPDTVIGIQGLGDIHLGALQRGGSMSLLPEPVDQPAELPAPTEED